MVGWCFDPQTGPGGLGLPSLPQTGPDQGDVVVAPSHHDLLDVGCRPKLGASVEREHNKAFEKRTQRQKKDFQSDIWEERNK